MTIKIYSDRIDIGDFTLFEGNGGLQFDGVARAENFLGNQSFQGSISGYRGGGYGPSSRATIAKFSFINNTPSTSVGNLTQARSSTAGSKSSTHGYAAGGTGATNTIDKFPFATDTNATDVGDLTVAINASNNGSSSSTHGYVGGGNGDPGGSLSAIMKYPFAIDSNASDIGTLAQARQLNTQQSSTTHGYISGGSNGPLGSSTNSIEKFPFSTDTNGTDIADLTQSRGSRLAGVSSKTHGYNAGGYAGPPVEPAGNVRYNTIDKFPFASDANATDVGDLTNTMFNLPGFSAVNFGYTGGADGGPSPVNTINRWPFATDTNAVDTGADMTSDANFSGAGTQV